MNSVIVEGVEVISRYDRPNEIESMANAVRTLHPVYREFVLRVFCDSKVGEFYNIDIKKRDIEVQSLEYAAKQIAFHFNSAFIESNEGHSGIIVKAFSNDPFSGRELCCLPDAWPDWTDEMEPCDDKNDEDKF